MLNIIGGLDHYTDGDLIINNKSTKRFTDADWDAYRNHSIGFVFQSYNLIPHQTVLANVELALTLSGVGPSERRQRASEALAKVGLGDQLHKKPSQMSGGQMQRVAIARALVNNPDILLADEPTGALDTETSVQIMDLLKEISKDKLIIMVTHNPELAMDYASRIIRLKDGVITDDSDPYDSGTGDTAQSVRTARKDRTSMSFFTALALSTNNLLTKKARTVLTAFAGSIGIIGIALIMSLSNGVQKYIDKVQEDTLSSYPLTIQAETVDMTSMMTSLMGLQAGEEGNQHEKDAVYSSTILYDMMNSMVSAEKQTNNLKAFKRYIENTDVEIASHISSIQYSYDMNMNIYAEDSDGELVKTDVTELMQRAMSETFGGDYSTYFATFGSAYNMMNAWQEMLPGDNGETINPLLRSQYDLLYGKWPENYDEVVLVVDKNNEVSDLVLYALGLKSSGNLSEDMETFINQENLNTELESWSYEDICKMVFRYIYPADEYQYDEETEEYISVADGDIGLRTLFNNGLPILNIDTYPGVYYKNSSGTEYKRMDDTYNTMVHEYQHLINYSNTSGMNSWLNECFSAAAEEICYPGSSVVGRIQSWEGYYYSDNNDWLNPPAEFQYQSSNSLHTGYSMYAWSNNLDNTSQEPRTAVGQRADGKIVIIALQGRQLQALGVTCRELAMIMLGYGCVDAGNLDGGASSDMYFRGKYLNVCNTSGGPRPIPTSVLVMPSRAATWSINRRNMASACSFRSARYPFSLPETSNSV